MLLSAMLGFMIVGCVHPEPNPANRITANETLPDDFYELIDLADNKIKESIELDNLAAAIAAYERAAVVAGEQFTWDVQWRLARACFLASEAETESSKKMDWITRGEDVAENAARERPGRVEAVYYLALLKGRKAQYLGVGLSAMILARKVEELGLRAEKLDSKYENCGPLRLLAMLYANAPSWPTSIGDIDLAIEYADRAVLLSDYPMNYLVRAEILIEDDNVIEAKKELERVLAAPLVGSWAVEGKRWRLRAEKLLLKIDLK